MNQIIIIFIIIFVQTLYNFFFCTHFPIILCTVQAYVQWQSYFVLLAHILLLFKLFVLKAITCSLY